MNNAKVSFWPKIKVLSCHFNESFNGQKVWGKSVGCPNIETKLYKQDYINTYKKQQQQQYEIQNIWQGSGKSS